MFDTYSILIVLAIALALVSFKYRNLLLSLGGVLSWLGLWVFHKDSPPMGIVQGSFLYELLLYAYIAMAIATFLMWLRNRSRGYTGYPLTKVEEAQINTRSEKRNPLQSGLLTMTPEEYRAFLHRKLRGWRR